MTTHKLVPVDLLQRVLVAFDDYAISVDADATFAHRRLYRDVETAIYSTAVDLDDSRIPDGLAVAAAHAVACPDQYAAPPCTTGDEHAAGRDVVRLCAIPLQFDAGTIYPDDHQEWSESVLGFHISYEPDEPEGERFRAAWGEGESESFGTLEAAQEHCQIEANAWVRKIARTDQSQEAGND